MDVPPPAVAGAGCGPEERRAHERAATLDALLQGVRDYAIYTIDPQGRIASWHRGAELMKGYSAAQAVGMPFEALFTPQDRAAGLPARELEVAADTGEYKGEGQRLRRDGRLIDVAVVLTALRGPAGELLGFLKLTQDITARRAAERDREDALQAARVAHAEAERVSRVKGEFLATLSHELRTPLSAMLGWAQVLERGTADTDTLRRGLDAISRNARLQVRLVEDLLDMTRIESGQLRLELRGVELDGLVAAAVDAARPAADARGLTLQAAFAPGGHGTLGDAARLQQVLAQLLDNAIKFTPRGGRIDVQLARDADGRAAIRVTDTGQGIAADFLPRLFDRFQQQDGTTARRHGGLGLGLAIARELVRLHGGELLAHSAGPGQGATMTVRLPLQELAAPPPAPAHAGEVAPPRLDGLSVLLVDDEADVRAMTAHVLRGAGADVAVAATVEEGLRLLQRERPAVLLSDIGMPVQDGYDLIRQVRALPTEAGGGVPAAALTAYAGRDQAERALQAGYQLHLAKPLAPQALVAAVARLASSAASRADLVS